MFAQFSLHRENQQHSISSHIIIFRLKNHVTDYLLISPIRIWSHIKKTVAVLFSTFCASHINFLFLYSWFFAVGDPIAGIVNEVLKRCASYGYGTYSRVVITTCVQKMWEEGMQYDNPEEVIRRLTAEVAHTHEHQQIYITFYLYFILPSFLPSFFHSIFNLFIPSLIYSCGVGGCRWWRYRGWCEDGDRSRTTPGKSI